MTSHPLNVLFLCAHNAARSLLAEAMLNHLDQLSNAHRFKAYSAGVAPTADGQPHPMTVLTLEHAGIATEGLHSKSWERFADPEAPHMDLIITVCDTAAGEPCPVWPGHPATAHWGFADPLAGDLSDAQRLEAFRHSLHEMGRRLELLLNLPQEKLEKSMLNTTAAQLAPTGDTQA